MFGVEAIPAIAAIGPSAISWWLICTLGFFIPFGLVTAELGLYLNRAGRYLCLDKESARRKVGSQKHMVLLDSDAYMASCDVYRDIRYSRYIFFPQVSLWFKVFISIIMIWVGVGINLCSLKFSKWVPNIGAISRLWVIFGMIAAAFVYFLRNKAFANTISFSGIIPELNAAIVFVPMIIYNLIGFELMSGAAAEMKDPVKDIPKTVILSAIVIISFYLICTFTIWVVVPVSEINVASGILQVFLVTFESWH
jgi:amino acid transporter